MWMTEHLANIELGRTFGKVFADIPLKDSAHVVHGDALKIDWKEVLPHEQCFAVMGNPPFVGAKFQTAEQRQQVRELAALGKSGGTLDFVAAWFIKAGAYIEKGPTRIGFVATNSISTATGWKSPSPTALSLGVPTRGARRAFTLLFLGYRLESTSRERSGYSVMKHTRVKPTKLYTMPLPPTYSTLVRSRIVIW